MTQQKITITELIKPQPKQLKALEALFDPECKYLLYGGAMAGGKSYILRWAAVSLLIYLYGKYKVKNIPVGLFSEDYPTLKDRQVSRIAREFPAWLGTLSETKTDGLAFVLHEEYGGGRILLRNLDDPSKYMSSEFAGIFVEELTRNTEQTFQDLRNRMRYPGIEEVKFMGATNPGGVGHGWVRKFFIDKNTSDPEKERFKYIHANVYDNQYVPDSYIKQLESLPPQKRKAYLEGSWDVFAGQYFPEFNRVNHVIPSFIPHGNQFQYIIGGLDWGRTAPFSCQFTGIERINVGGGKAFYRAKTFAEIYGTQKTPQEWGEVIKKELAFFHLQLSDVQTIWCDNQIFTPTLDNSKAIVDQMGDSDQRFRTLCKPASKDRIGGWENLHNWLGFAPDGLPYWQMTENCSALIRTLPELVHDEVKIEDVDSDGEDHAGDAMRYTFKGIKWINGEVGGVGGTDTPKFTPYINRRGETRSINLDRFQVVSKRRKFF